MSVRNRIYFITTLLALGVALNAYANENYSTPYTTTITANAFRTAVDLPGGFNIAKNETIIIKQPSADSRFLIRDVAGNPSVISGHLFSNGRILLVNDSGIILGAGSQVNAPNLTVESQNGIYSRGSLIIPHTLILRSGADIYSLGVLESSSLIERGNTFKVGGIFYPGNAHIMNADQAMHFSPGTTIVVGNITDEGKDSGNIIIDPRANLMMKNGSTSFTATGAFQMDSTASIDAGEFNLSITAGSTSTLGSIDNGNLVTLNSDSNAVFKFENAINVPNLTNHSTIDLNGQSVTVTGMLINDGTLKITGSEKISVGTFNDSGTTDYDGSDAYTITPLGTYNNLQFDNGTFKLAGALIVAANLTNEADLDLNGQSLTVTDTFTNKGTLKLIGSEKPSIGTLTDIGTVDYYGSDAYTITAFGTYNNLQFDNGTFQLGGTFITSVNLTNNANLDFNGQSLTVAGRLINKGTLKLIGSEKPSIGTLTDSGTIDYYGNDAYTITPLGTCNNLQFDNGTFKLPGGGAISAANLTNNSTLDLNGQSVTITDTFTNNGTLKLIGSEEHSIHTFIDKGTTGYDGSNVYTIRPLGTTNDLQFDNGTFKLAGGGQISSANLINNATFDLNNQSLTVGRFANNGTFRLIGSEKPSIGTFTDNGTIDYYGSETYTITLLGPCNNLQFDNGIFVLGGALTAAGIINNATFILNGQSVTVTGTLTNHGALKLVGSQTRSIHRLLDQGTID